MRIVAKVYFGLMGSLVASLVLLAGDDKTLEKILTAVKYITIVEVRELPYDGGSIWVCIKDDRNSLWGIQIEKPYDTEHVTSKSTWVFLTNTNISYKEEVQEESAIEKRLVLLLARYAANNKSDYAEIISETTNILRNRKYDKRRLDQAYRNYNKSHMKLLNFHVSDTNNPFRIPRP